MCPTFPFAGAGSWPMKRAVSSQDSIFFFSLWISPYNHDKTCIVAAINCIKKSRLQKTLNLSTDADSITIAMIFFRYFLFIYFWRGWKNFVLGGGLKHFIVLGSIFLRSKFLLFGRQTDRQTDSHPEGHGDSMTELAEFLVLVFEDREMECNFVVGNTKIDCS